MGLMMIASPLLSDTNRIEVSEDGHCVVVIENSDNEPVITETNDIVPYSEQPDWTCDLRMQVGGLAMADLDGDDDLDLAVGCYHSQSYPPYDDWRNFILYNIDGQLQSSPVWWSDDESSSTDVRIADFDNDGHPDIFAANGDFAFQPSRIYYYGDNDSIQTQAGWTASDNTWTTCAASFDFDQDGDIDVATSNQGASPDPYRPVHIFINNAGNLETSPSWSSSANEISGYLSWGDYNNDGWYDLAVSKWANFHSGVYRNNEGIVGQSPVFSVNTDDTQKGIGWSYVDDDNYPELAIGGSGLPTHLYPNDEGVLGSSPIWQSSNSYHGVQDLTWADVDNDGDEDLATVHFSTGHLRIYLNINGELEQTPSWQYDASQVGTAVTFGDINGDGALDLVMGVSGEPCVMVFYNDAPISVDENKTFPQTTCLSGNYPNPFNAQTRISFCLEKRSRVSLQIYNLLGNHVATLVDSYCHKGHHNIIWDGTDEHGKQVSSGVYFCRLETEKEVFTSRMAFLK